MSDIENHTETSNEVQVEEKKERRGRPKKPPREKPPPKPKGRKPKEYSIFNDNQALKDYRNSYYHSKLKTDYTCPICGDVLGSRISYNYHIRNNKDCELIKMKKEIIELNQKIVSQTDV